jgi:hypothetical protein
MAAACACLLACTSAMALSEIQTVEPTAPTTGAPEGGTLVPPGGSVVREALKDALPGTGVPAGGGAPVPSPQVPSPTPDITGPSGPSIDVPELPVQRDTTTIPLEVQALRGLILEAARSGDIEKLRPILGTGDEAAQLSLTDGPLDDPVAYLRDTGGLPDGTEILAIMLDILESGFVLMDEGTPDAIYVWPYFVGRPLETLTPPERVELLRIVTAGDLEDMQAYGAYTFYRLGITPQGKLAFFLAGD